ncbi:MAG: RDD family protein [Acidimicrobiales bacterium]
MVDVQTYSTPPVSGVADPTAVLGRRILAWIIDTAIGVVLFVGLFLAIADSADAGSSAFAEEICDRVNEVSDDFCAAIGSQVYVAPTGDLALISLVVLAYGVFFHVLLPGVAGYSIGKSITGLRVVQQTDGQLAGIGANAVRWLLWIVDWAPFIAPLVGLITGLTTKGHRRVGDMAAGTLVVDKSQVGVLPVIAGLTAPAGPSAVGGVPPQAAGSWSPPPPTPPVVPPAGTGAPPVFPPPSEPATTPPPDQSFPPVAPPSTAPAAFPPPGGAGASSQPDDATTILPSSPADTPTTVVPTAASAPPDEPAGAPPAGDAPPPSEPPASGADVSGSAQAEVPPGVEEPKWDDARNTYIQWDPEFGQWMEWSETQGRWIPISS